MSAHATPLARPTVTADPPARSLWGDAADHLRRDRLTVAAVGMVAAFVALALAADAISGALGVSATAVDLAHRFQPPSGAHWLGTDEFGRDELARVLGGARVSLGVATSAALVTIVLGVSLGASAAMYGGFVDDAFTWLVNTMRAIPSVFLLLIIAALFHVGPLGLALIIGLTSWMAPARLVRGQALELKAREFVTSARAVGARDRRIILRHIAPNLVPIISVLIGIDVGQAILRESALSYLGLGIQPPDASWGNMLTNAQSYFSRGPWLVVAPGLAITVVVWCLYAIGDGVRDAVDPRVVR
ncbi:MAG TPA: ABC transporter permease [Candidatus Limnocylindria bacterium]